MRRFRKVFIFVGACALALVLSVRHRGEDLQVEANASAPRSGAADGGV